MIIIGGLQLIIRHKFAVYLINLMQFFPHKKNVFSRIHSCHHQWKEDEMN